MSEFSIREVDSTKEFDGIASVCVKGRPAYVEGFIDDLYNKFGVTTESIVADISSEMTQRCFYIYIKYCPKFKEFGGGIQKDDIRIKEFFADKYKYLEYDNPLFYDRETFISRSLSGSYSLKSNEEGFDEYVAELRAVFGEYANEGIISMPNKTVVYWGTIAM